LNDIKSRKVHKNIIERNFFCAGPDMQDITNPCAINAKNSLNPLDWYIPIVGASIQPSKASEYFLTDERKDVSFENQIKYT